jgi:L-alanine-DL-glutamate epimerase-like enolase superfamily enzyme
VAAIHAFEPHGVFWYEEPLHWYDATRGLGRLARHTRVPFASGESEPHFWACRDLVDLGAVSYLNFDGTRNGGVTEWLRIAAYARAHGVKMTTHHDPQIQGHLVSGVANGYCVEAFADPARDPLWDTLFSHRAQIRGGALHLSDEPGFGFGIDWTTVERHRA